MYVFVLWESKEPPSDIEPELNPEVSLVARLFNCIWSFVGFDEVVVDWPIGTLSVWITDSMTVEPYRTPTIFILPVSIPR